MSNPQPCCANRYSTDPSLHIHIYRSPNTDSRSDCHCDTYINTDSYASASGDSCADPVH